MLQSPKNFSTNYIILFLVPTFLFNFEREMDSTTVNCKIISPMNFTLYIRSYKRYCKNANRNWSLQICFSKSTAAWQFGPWTPALCTSLGSSDHHLLDPDVNIMTTFRSLARGLCWRVLKPNSRTYKFVEVSGHNLDSSQTWDFRLQCLNYKTVLTTLFYQAGGSKIR